MKSLTNEERKFLERVTQSHEHKRENYWYYTFRKKHYKRGRVLLQLHINKKLEIWELVHHKNKDKENDSIENLEVIDTKNFGFHSSLHHAGTRGRRNKSRKKSNKLDEKIVSKIIELSKKYKRESKSNYSKIGRELGISGFTVCKYLKNGKK